VLCVVVVAFLLRRALRVHPEDVGLRLAIMAFAASPALVFFVHLVGYLDYVGLVAVASLLLLLGVRPTRRYAIFYAAAAMGVVFALVHEALAAMFGPVVFFALLCHIVGCSRERSAAPLGNRVMLAHAVLVTGAMFVASAMVGTLGTRPAWVVRALAEAIAEHANFPLRPHALEALRRSTSDAVLYLMPRYYRRPGVAGDVLRPALLFLPGFAFLVYYGLHSIGRLGLTPGARRVLRAAFLAATVAPLSLNLVGWDHARWNSVAVVATMLCVAAAKLLPASPEAASQRRALRSPLVLTLGAAAVVLGLSADNVLYDGYTVPLFPFERHVDSLLDLARGGFRFVPQE